jgi:hypothetical protein
VAEFGIGVPKNTNSALIFYEKSCILRSVLGCIKGIIATNDTSKRKKLLEIACQLKDAMACKRLYGKLKLNRCASAMNHAWNLGSAGDYDGTLVYEKEQVQVHE